MLESSLNSLSIEELLALHSSALDELQRRGVLRTKNNPTGDYAEWLFAERLGLQLAENSAKGYDATDGDGLRYQIKSRRITSANKSRQLGVLRDLDANEFDFLLAVLFDDAWQITHAVKIPHSSIARMSTFRAHQNGHILILRPILLNDPDVVDVTHLLNGDRK
jgi:hypothetical protein